MQKSLKSVVVKAVLFVNRESKEVINMHGRSMPYLKCLC